MKKGKNLSEDIRFFYETIKVDNNNNKNNNIVAEIITVKDVVEASKEEQFKCRRKIEKFSYKASDEELIEVAKILVDEKQEQMKANLLRVFRKRGFPLETDIIIEYTKSENVNLAQNAFEILSITKNEIVREYALELISSRKYLEESLSILLRNYQEKDEVLVLSLLKRIKVKYREDLWHRVYSDAITWMEQGRKAPENIIIFLYENTLCSCCREYIVRVMSKRGILNETFLMECLHDSNQDIRKFAEYKYRRINRSLADPL